MISLAFAIVLGGLSVGFVYYFIISALTVGIGFLFHELGHKVVAQKYGAWAEFRANDQMLVLALLMSFMGFVIAAPGAVVILGRVNKRQYGKISVAGPLVNFVLAAVFYALLFLAPVKGLSLLFFYGALINSWLGLFNMLPFGNFDGIKILRWNKLVYGVMVAFGVAFLILQQFAQVTMG